MHHPTDLQGSRDFGSMRPTGHNAVGESPSSTVKVPVDSLSRGLHVQTEWMLGKMVVAEDLSGFGAVLKWTCFTTQLNNRLPVVLCSPVSDPLSLTVTVIVTVRVLNVHIQSKLL